MEIARFVEATDVPAVDTKQMIEVDRVMIEEYRISLIQMMENAGRNLAHLARARFLAGDPRDKHVVVLAGGGGNGGGALAAARRLACWGADIRVVLAQSRRGMGDVPTHQLNVLSRMNITPLSAAEFALVDHRADLVLDGLIGYSLSGAPVGDAARLIRWTNIQPAPVLALDTPSGLDASSGRAPGDVVMADATMTLALPKTGLIAPTSAELIGELYLADISVPPALYEQGPFAMSVGPIFAQSDIVRLL